MQFVFEKLVPARREELFAFHQFPRHLLLLHQGWAQLRMLHHEERVRVGGETWVEQKVGGLLPVILGFRHHLLEPPFRFGEELVHGPFSLFRHIHEFGERGNQTLVRDVIEVGWPWQFGGRLTMALGLKRSIQEMFRLRGEAMVSLAESGRMQAALERTCR